MHKPCILTLLITSLFLSACADSTPSDTSSAERKEPTSMNRLAKETSPYLLQHKTNPVDWYPWGEEAFEAARKQNKPIFLSVGYSTCHWCHVMNRESFTDPDTAKILNEHFIAIKVDREERPDVDQLYMTFVQATTGSGGWPMSVWLTPERKPIVGGTYFPPKDAYGRPGFPTVLKQIAEAWETQEDALRKQAGDITQQLRAYTARAAAGDSDLPNLDLLDQARRQLASRFDEEYGGFGSAPKFPSPAQLFFLLAEARRDSLSPDPKQQARSMAEATLDAMRRGGIHDHIGGGFHRYSVDTFWHIPHYEKMLYDQAQLVSAFVEAYQLNRNPLFADAARDTLAYVQRDLTDPQGGFYSAEDADSLASPDADHKTEGAFYLWTDQEIGDLLRDQAPMFRVVYGVEKKGNAPQGSDPHGDLKGTNTLIRRLSDAEAAEKFDLTTEEVHQHLSDNRDILFQVREKRLRPHLDDKVITAWNGLMISAFARASSVLGEKTYLETATRAADFLRGNLYDPEGQTLKRTWRGGQAGSDGFASDYVFLISGLIDLYQAGFDPKHLQWALELQATLDKRFLDSKAGGYFESEADDPHLLFRMKETYDGAEPSANTLAALNLLRLSHLLGDPELSEQAGTLLRSLSDNLQQQPLSALRGLLALKESRTPGKQVVIVGDPEQPTTQAMLGVARELLSPDTALIWIRNQTDYKFFAGKAEFFQGLNPENATPATYVCENFVCNLPLTQAEDLRRQLTNTR